MFRVALRTQQQATRAVGRRNASTVAVQNLEGRWKTLSTAEQNTIAKQLEEAQKGDWKALTADEKKASYYIAFGPHGPREPLTGPGHTQKVIAGTLAVLAVSGGLFALIRTGGKETPITVNKEWEAATNEYLKSQNSNPISGISSEGYKGTGYIVSK
ncbi:cytochrome c oxidase subunit IV [Halteromyces radiatus]|uniref:cytochrome c oxidase subunit IV n=1 Tax=Halteromyces radiatus TaxID=101107 RepID=UPI00221E7777|nr:cytochrome c oxidase subunit IV [Halteromyces radiatus]KAI8092578.1 cytochrome c oxidase subunit IV [Halteromyces radiatus]